MTTKTDYEIVDVYAVSGYNESGYYTHTLAYFSSKEEAETLAKSLDYKSSHKYFGHNIGTWLQVDTKMALKINDKHFIIYDREPITVK